MDAQKVDMFIMLNSKYFESFQYSKRNPLQSPAFCLCWAIGFGIFINIYDRRKYLFKTLYS